MVFFVLNANNSIQATAESVRLFVSQAWFASNSMHPAITLESVFVATSVGFSAVFGGSIHVVGLDTHSIKSFVNVSALQN